MKVKVSKCRNEIQTEDNLGLSHDLEQYLERYTKENKKNTGLCTKNKNQLTHIILKWMDMTKCDSHKKAIGPRHEKTCLRGF